jgi:peptide/nickel transport system permease protein
VNRLAVSRVGFALAAAAVLLAVLGPLFAPHSPTAFVDAPLSSPSARAPLGTDFLGEDVLSRVLWGGRSVLLMATAATAIGAAVGVVVGAVAASAPKWVDDLLMAGSDVVLAFPQLVLTLLFVSIIGPKLWLIVLVLGLTHAPRVARLTRGLTRDVRSCEFVEADEALGVPRWRTFLDSVLPSITAPLSIELGVRMAWSVGYVASLSFLGLGVQRPNADWGRMINENRDGLTVQPWAVLVPTLCIAAFTIGTNLVCSGVAARAGARRRSAT